MKNIKRETLSVITGYLRNLRSEGLPHCPLARLFLLPRSPPPLLKGPWPEGGARALSRGSRFPRGGLRRAARAIIGERLLWPRLCAAHAPYGLGTPSTGDRGTRPGVGGLLKNSSSSKSSSSFSSSSSKYVRPDSWFIIKLLDEGMSGVTSSSSSSSSLSRKLSDLQM